MLKFKAVEDRQNIIEDIFAELEALLMGKNGNAEEEDILENSTQHSIINFSKTESGIVDTVKDPTGKIASPSDPNYQYYALIQELLNKKSLLQGALKRIDTLVEVNTM